MKRLFRFLIPLLFMATQALSATLYVSPRGNDSNPGTKAMPLATMTGARNKIRSMTPLERNAGPVFVIIEGGDYFITEPFTLTGEDSGTESAPVTYQSAGTEKPVINGAKLLPKFERVSDKLWKLAAGSDHFEQLYVNGKRAVRAQSPEFGTFYHVKGMTEKVITDTKTKRWPERSEQKIQLTANELKWAKSLSKAEQNEVVFTFYLAWDIVRRKMTSFDLADSSVTLIGEGARPWNKVNAKTTFTVDNSKSFLDAEGEWFLENSGTLFYVPRKGESVETTTALAPVMEKLLVLNGNTDKEVQYVNFQNISFQYSGYAMPAEGYGPEQASAGISAALMADYAGHIQFTNCEILHTANYGLWFRTGCSDNIVQSCRLSDLGSGGIKVGNTSVPANEGEVTNHTIIDNNIITSGGHIFPTGVGVLVFHSGDNVITHNDISDLRYSGISVGWIWGYSPSYAKNNTISFNHIHHLGWGVLSDMGGVYLLGPAPGTVVKNNVIHHIYSYDYGGWGLYTDEGSTGVVLENNLVYACKSSGFHQHYGKENIIRNNIFASQVKAQLEATRVEDHLSFIFKHNIIYEDQGILSDKNWTTVKFLADSNSYWDTRTKDIRFGKQSFVEWKVNGKDVNSIIADPVFRNAAKADYHIGNTNLLAAINFHPFDYSVAGVYGSAAWKKTAELNKELEKNFDSISRQNEYKPK